MSKKERLLETRSRFKHDLNNLGDSHSYLYYSDSEKMKSFQSSSHAYKEILISYIKEEIAKIDKDLGI